MSATGQEPTAPSEPSEPTEAPSAPAGDGLDRVFARMDEIAQQVSGIGQRVDGITQLVTPEEPEPEYYDDEGGWTEEGAQRYFEEMIDRRVEERMAPREAAALVQRRDEMFEDLRETYPELRDEATANKVLAAAIGLVNEWGHPEMVETPAIVTVIERVLTHDKYSAMAAQQAAEQPRSVVLESGQGAARQVQKDEPDWGARIVAAAERARPQI